MNTPRENIPSEVIDKLADLTVQAAMFEMDIDIETMSLTPKKSYSLPIWIKRWRNKEQGSDRTPQDYEGGKDER